LTSGFEAAGYRVVQAIESCPHAAATYAQNHPDVDVVLGDIRKMDAALTAARVGLDRHELDILLAGPPCQGFSESNKRTRTLLNPANGLYQEFLRFLGVLNPSWFLFENVPGLLTLSEGSVLKAIQCAAKELGYESEWRVVNALNYGVPQNRRRVFLVGNRTGTPISFPEPTHGTTDTARAVTVGEAIRDLPVLENGASTDRRPFRKPLDTSNEYLARVRDLRGEDDLVSGNLVTHNSEKVVLRYKHVGQGQNWTQIPRHLMDNYHDLSRCHTGVYYRLRWDEPAKVLGNFRKNMLIHPEQDRGLSIREAARLQSFSDSYVFTGSIGFQQQQVADSVPPLLALTVALEIRRHDISFDGAMDGR